MKFFVKFNNYINFDRIKTELTWVVEWKKSGLTTWFMAKQKIVTMAERG